MSQQKDKLLIEFNGEVLKHDNNRFDFDMKLRVKCGEDEWQEIERKVLNFKEGSFGIDEIIEESFVTLVSNSPSFENFGS